MTYVYRWRNHRSFRHCGHLFSNLHIDISGSLSLDGGWEWEGGWVHVCCVWWWGGTWTKKKWKSCVDILNSRAKQLCKRHYNQQVLQKSHSSTVMTGLIYMEGGSRRVHNDVLRRFQTKIHQILIKKLKMLGRCRITKQGSRIVGFK